MIESHEMTRKLSLVYCYKEYLYFLKCFEEKTNYLLKKYNRNISLFLLHFYVVPGQNNRIISDTYECATNLRTTEQF